MDGPDRAECDDGRLGVSVLRPVPHSRPRQQILLTFQHLIDAAGVQRVPLPPRAPNLNAYAERWVRSVKEEALSQLILFGERALRHALTEYITHYHTERPHQGKENSVLMPAARVCSLRGPSNAVKGLVDSSSITAIKRHEDVDATRMLRMVGTQTPPQEKPASITQRVTLYGISWQTYTRILVELGDQRASRLAYAHGVLEITMPSDRQETYKKLLERMIETLTEELNLPAKSFGATTLNRADLEHGAEPDSCYYIQHVHQIEGRQVDLATDPPPDLILEIDILALPVDASIYTNNWACRRFGATQVGTCTCIVCKTGSTFPVTRAHLFHSCHLQSSINSCSKPKPKTTPPSSAHGVNGYGSRSPQNLASLGCNEGCYP